MCCAAPTAAHFAPIARPPFAPTVRAFRTLQPFQQRLHISPTASGSHKGFLQDISSEAVICANADLRTDQWVPVSEEGFGNPDNVTVFEMADFDGHLYGGTINPNTGGELWKTRGNSLPYRWGTGHHQRRAAEARLNEAAATICGNSRRTCTSRSASSTAATIAVQHVGLAAAEVTRLAGRLWDLLVGEARMTEQGLKYPLSGYGPGFDSLFNGYIWRMCVHDGWLYAGTLNWTNTLPLSAIGLLARGPADACVQRWGAENLVSHYGGAELWRTHDGIHWEPVTRSGFGNKFNWGFRTLASTPHGLFVGTANPYAPNVAVKARQVGATSTIRAVAVRVWPARFAA